MASLDQLSDEELVQLYANLQRAFEYRRTHTLEYFIPYPMQQEFFDLGGTKRERLYQAGNQLYGKTTAGAVESAYHLTGLYPKNWVGHRWDRPTRGLAVGESGGWVRDQAQSRLCGLHTTATKPGDVDWGTGFIPKELLLDRTLTHGTQNAFDSISVRHVSGGISYFGFKSYEQGRAKVQGPPLDFVWPDECPPDDIYFELMARIAQTHGIIFTTFTPMKGATGVTARFTDDEGEQALKDRGRVIAGIRDVVGHTPEYIASVIDSYPAHEREARINGEIMMGEGAVFEGVNEEMIKFPAMELSKIPQHWRKIWGMDFGIGHPFAATLLGHDADTDIIYVMHEIRMADVLPQHHVAAIRGIAAMPPVAWPRDGTNREKSNGVELHHFYEERNGQPGLNMRFTHATLAEGGISTNAGVTEILERMRRGKFLVFSTCLKWFQEFRGYHRKNGLIVRVGDDLMSATRQGVMDIRYAQPVPLGPAPAGVFKSQRPRQIAEVDIWTNQPIY